MDNYTDSEKEIASILHKVSKEKKLYMVSVSLMITSICLHLMLLI